MAMGVEADEQYFAAKYCEVGISNIVEDAAICGGIRLGDFGIAKTTDFGRACGGSVALPERECMIVATAVNNVSSCPANNTSLPNVVRS